MNQVILTGNLGDDPKEFYTPDGVSISSFSWRFARERQNLMDQGRLATTSWLNFPRSACTRAPELRKRRARPAEVD